MCIEDLQAITRERRVEVPRKKGKSKPKSKPQGVRSSIVRSPTRKLYLSPRATKTCDDQKEVFVFSMEHEIGDVHAVAKVIFESIRETQPSSRKGKSLEVGRVRNFIQKAELLPPGTGRADLDVLLTKHSQRTSVLSAKQFEGLLADIALILIKAEIIFVNEAQCEEGEPWEWGIKAPIARVSKSDALDALGFTLDLIDNQNA